MQPLQETKKAEDLKAKGVDVRLGDYNDKASLIAAFDLKKLLGRSPVSLKEFFATAYFSEN